jgi:hypothetical protein
MSCTAVLAVGSLYFLRSTVQETTAATSHLTFYVQEPLLSQGGTVVLAAIPIPAEQWRSLTGPNFAPMIRGTESAPV